MQWLGEISMNINKLTAGLDGGSRAKADATNPQNAKPEESTKTASSVATSDQVKLSSSSTVSYTQLTLPTTPYV